MFVVATAGPVAPRLTMHINVFLKDTDSQSNQKAFSQDSLFRGYARGEKNKKQKHRHWLCYLHLCGGQQRGNSMKSRGCFVLDLVAGCFSSLSVLCF